MQFLKYTLILVCILVFSNGLIAGNNDPINDKPAVFEIEDKY